MPSAANGKLEKQVPSENSLGDANSSSLRQVITYMEHKIRNMEKRKMRLESLRDLQNAGKELNADQKIAVDRYNEVLSTLEFAKEVNKQTLSIANASEKEAKKQAKKEMLARTQAETARLREVLLAQDALIQMGNDSVREDFLIGRNGAAQLTENDLKLLDEFYPLITPKHEAGNPTVFTNDVQQATDHLMSLVDGKPKEILGGTYSQIKEILGKIHESGYFDQAPNYEFDNNEEVSPQQLQQQQQNDEIIENNLTNDNNIQLSPNNNEFIPIGNESSPPQQPLQQSPPQLTPQQQQQIQPPIDVIPSMEVLPTNAVISQQPHPAIEPSLQAEPAPTLYYAQQPPTLPPQPPRPLSEMLGTGTFFFLQDSELDSPPEQIPSQTFTNQNYVSGPPPSVVVPQAIPIPTLYPNIPPPQPQQQQPLQPQPQPKQNNIQQQQPTPPQQQHQKQQAPLPPQQSLGGAKPTHMNSATTINNNNANNNNGIDDNKQKQLADNTHLNNNINNNNNYHNNNINKHGNGHRSGKSYYQNNNNGYNNNNNNNSSSSNGRPRQSRNGPRTGNRHN